MWTIYTRDLCNYCDMAKAEMDLLKINYKVINQTKETKSELIERSGISEDKLTYPQIFHDNGELIGGYADLLDYTEDLNMG